MAQKYLELFRDSAETHYASGVVPTVSLARLNKAAQFIEVKAGGTVKFNVNRLKRVKGQANAAKTGKFGDDLTSQLNLLGKVEWDTVTTQSGAEQIIGVWIDINETTDFLENAGAYESAISDMVLNVLIGKEEEALETVKAGGTFNATALDLTDDEAVVKAISGAVTAKKLLVDDYKAYSNNIIVEIHPLVAESFARVQGQSYQTGTNTFPEALGSGFRYNQTDYIVNSALNVIEGQAATETLGAIVMDSEAYANAGLEAGMKAIDETYLGERIAGHKSYGLDIVIDPARIELFEFKQAAGKKVNA